MSKTMVTDSSSKTVIAVSCKNSLGVSENKTVSVSNQAARIVEVHQRQKIAIAAKSNSVKINGPDEKTVVEVRAQGPQGAPGQFLNGAISLMTDVDISGLKNESVLVYNATAQKWVVQRNVNEILDGGNF